MSSTEDQQICEGCHGSGGNWDCGGENYEREYPQCTCVDCTGDERCQECGGCGVYDCPGCECCEEDL